MFFKKIKLNGVLIFLVGAAHVATVQANDGMEPKPDSKINQVGCMPVSIIEPTTHKPRSFVIQAPGHYCLMENLTFSYNPLNPLGLLAGGNGALGKLELGAVLELDLAGHTLHTNFPAVYGLRIDTRGAVNNLPRNTIIKNGKLVTRYHAIEASFSGIYPWYDKPYKVGGRNAPSNRYQDASDGDISTQITLENLDITVNENAVFLEGNDNIIRNCKIRVKGFNAIQIYGNNVQILNNEIIVESKYAHKNEERRAVSMAPIMLRDGDNALISGNKITIKGDEANRPAQAISLRDSRNVRIENNQFIGAQTIYKAFEAFTVESTATESNNSLKTKTGWFD